MDYLEIDWNQELEANKNDVNYTTNKFFTKMDMLMDKHLPVRKLTKKELKKRHKPWITDEILEIIDKKDTVFKKYIKCKMETRKQELHEEYNTVVSSNTFNIVL